MKATRRPTPKARALHLAGLLLIVTQPMAAEAGDALGRLFFTPEHRQRLDRQRQMTAQGDQEANERRLTINGMVTRSDGKRTAWINGAPQDDDEMRGGLSVTTRSRDAGKVTVRASESPAANARVGGTEHRDAGEPQDLLNGGRVGGQIRGPARPSAGGQ